VGARRQRQLHRCAPGDVGGGIDLDGRAFLHDYRWREDKDFSVLSGIFGGPLVVTHWINAQYNASTTDNLRYGAGNKVLHNVVGGTLGVLEGNGGDLRIGLSWQSIHDGKTLQHTPLAIGIFVCAPRAALDAQLAQNEVVKQLVEGGWIHLHQLDDEQQAVFRWTPQGWSEMSAA
jgi:uncharacterized protein YbcC (UPF0753/DUF2309 family)